MCIYCYFRRQHASWLPEERRVKTQQIPLSLSSFSGCLSYSSAKRWETQLHLYQMWCFSCAAVSVRGVGSTKLGANETCPQPCPPLPHLPTLFSTARLQPGHTPAAAFLLVYVSIPEVLPLEIVWKVSSVLHDAQAVTILSACARSGYYTATSGTVDLEGKEIVYCFDLSEYHMHSAH